MSCHIPPERQLRRLSKSGKKTPSIPLLDLNVLNRKPTSGRSGSPWAIGPCAYLKATRLRGFGLVIMPPTKAYQVVVQRSRIALLHRGKTLRVLKESHLITDRGATSMFSPLPHSLGSSFRKKVGFCRSLTRFGVQFRSKNAFATHLLKKDKPGGLISAITEWLYSTGSTIHLCEGKEDQELRISEPVPQNSDVPNSTHFYPDPKAASCTVATETHQNRSPKVPTRHQSFPGLTD